jgi:hypothetical protein
MFWPIAAVDRMSALGPACVKRSQRGFDGQNWNENRVPTQIFGLLISQTLPGFYVVTQASKWRMHFHTAWVDRCR